jgi:ATP-binding cassette subfamily F protein 3
LLLDEPTNHLDLEMRQALGRALLEFPGAIVVISHDRHLLRSVCDELLVVHDGRVERFDRDIDGYAAWLKEQDEPDEAGKEASMPGNAAADRRRKRREDAERRRRLSPLTGAVRRAEERLEQLRGQLDQLEHRLADTSLYSDDADKEVLTGLLREQAGIRSKIETAEAEWLQASEALESALQAGED